MTHGLIVAALLLGIQPVLAQPSTEPAHSDFVRLDRNRDGSISRVETLADPQIQKRLGSFDQDKDGLLSEAEFAMAREDVTRAAVVDAAISARVRAALLAAPNIPSLSIAVSTYEGRVQLSGFVGSPEIVSRAGRVTRGVDGVRAVHNNISVK